MKKLTTILLLFTLFSCGDDTVTLSKDEYNRLKGSKKSEYPKPYKIYGDEYNDWEILLGEDGHEYLKNDGYNSFVLIHYPGCKKCLKDSTETL